ncbi:MAG TPA: LuxR C-terminal-related transcriptional regulator [Bacteroidales bacterium]|nr:LuxR C-terminal-related transcriptional regulator [Bacteroidales bacterium]
MENAIGNSLPESLMDSLHAFFYVVDFEKRTMISSIGNISNIIGCHPPDALMFPLELAEELHHPKDRALVRESLDGFSKNNTQTWAGFYRIKHCNDNWVWVYSKISIHKNVNGYNQLVVGMVMDILSGIPSASNLESVIRENARWKYAEKIKQLTPRELMIVKLIAEGYCYKDIAAQLYIQPDTVNKHRKNILRKLGLKNIAMLACFAKETGLV